MHQISSTKVGRPETKGIHEGVSILELHNAALGKRPTTVHKAVIISKASKCVWVGRGRWRKPATVDMDICGRTLWYACVHYLNTVLRNASRAVSALHYANVFVCTSICNTPTIHITHYSSSLPTFYLTWHIKLSPHMSFLLANSLLKTLTIVLLHEAWTGIGHKKL